MQTNDRPKESKRERFVRVVERRVSSILGNLESLGKCSNRRNYEYSENDVRKIFATLEAKLKETKTLFQPHGEKKNRFKL